MTYHPLRTGVHVLAVMAFLSLGLLLEPNMGSQYVNEVDVLPLARQYADPSWLADDWYLNHPAGYRLLFSALFGKLVVLWGFLATSILGRLLCYGLVAAGLALIGRALGLSLPLLLLAAGGFFYATPFQGMIAREWVAAGLEPKAVAYGVLLVAVGLMLQGYYRGMALMLGLATSFHVLVGGWAAVAVVGWLALRRRTHGADRRSLGALLLIYVMASAFGLRAVLEQFLTPAPIDTISPSYVYVFLRLPQHLNPLSWSAERWVKPCGYLLVLALSLALLWRQRRSAPGAKHYQARLGLAALTLLALIPFALGVAIAPFDAQGAFLQYYPFRLGDVLLPTHRLFAVGVCPGADLHRQSPASGCYSSASCSWVGSAAPRWCACTSSSWPCSSSLASSRE